MKNSENNDKTPVSVLGTGAMGSAIARTLLAAGHPTTVWNRSPEKTAPLAAEGAVVAPSAGQAMEASPLVVLCLIDQKAVREVLDASTGSVPGRVLANLTSHTPDQARAAAVWASDHDADYLAGGIIADPPDLGTSDAHLYYSGSARAFEVHRVTLETLGGGTRHFGVDPGAAPLHFLAVTSLGYEVWAAYLRTVSLFRSEGFDAGSFTPHAVDIVGDMVAFLPGLATEIDNRTYQPDLGPLRTQAALMDDQIETREVRGVDAGQLRFLKTLMDRRVGRGYGDQGFSSLIEELDG